MELLRFYAHDWSSEEVVFILIVDLGFLSVSDVQGETSKKTSLVFSPSARF